MSASHIITRVGAPINTPRRVLFVVPQPYFAHRGSPLRVLTALRALIELGFKVDLLVYGIGEDRLLEGVTIHRCWNPPFVKRVPIGASAIKILLDIFLVFKAISLCRRNSYAVIHGVEEAGFIAAFLGKVFSIPFVFDLHSLMSEQLASNKSVVWRAIGKVVAGLEKFSIRRAAGVITVGDSHANRLKQIAPSVPIVAIEDRPLELSPASASKITEFRNSCGGQATSIIGYTGNFEAYQGIELLLCAFKLASTELCNSKLLLVGGGDVTHPQVIKIQALVQEFNLAEKVIFTGERPVSEMNLFMEAADILVSPRLSGENTPLKIYSYMASGKPIVATRIKSHTQVLTDEIAYLAEIEPEHLASVLIQAVKDLSSGAEILQSRIKGAQALACSRFSFGQFVERLAEVYSPFISLETVPVNVADQESKAVIRAGR